MADLLDRPFCATVLQGLDAGEYDRDDHDGRYDTDQELDEEQRPTGQLGGDLQLLGNVMPTDPTCNDGKAHRAQRHAAVTRYVVEQVEDVLVEELDVAHGAETERAEQTDDGGNDGRDDDGRLTGHARFIRDGTDDGFNHGDGARQGGERQAQVEGDGEQLTEGQLREDGGHRHEGQTGTGIRIEAESEDGRHDHQTAEQCGDDGQESDPAGGGKQVGTFGEVRTVCHHGTGTEREREESEAHGIQKGVGRDGFPLGHEQEFNAGPGTGQG